MSGSSRSSGLRGSSGSSGLRGLSGLRGSSGSSGLRGSSGSSGLSGLRGSSGLRSDVQVCHQRKDTTLMVFDLILSPTLNLALSPSPSPMNTVIS